jgi:hypothetical protein
MKTNRGIEVNDKESGTDADTPSRATRTRSRSFPPHTTQEELSEALEPLGKYERLVMRMSLALRTLSQAAGLSERTYWF